MKTILFFALITVSIAFDSCSSPKTKGSFTHNQLFLKGSSNNKLEVLDWGGAGKPVLFLSGLGNTAHIFDDFAPKFTDHFHVYGLTRRGFGSSAQIETGYNTKTLAEDILPVLDGLRITKVILIGHSIGGQELSKFASSHPDRVEKIIYLDGAYDFNFRDSSEIATYRKLLPPPTTEDLSSADKLNQLIQKEIEGPAPMDDLKETTIFSKDGRYLKDVTPDAIIKAIFQNVEHPDYVHIKCPALAIYAIHKSVDKLCPSYRSFDSANRKIVNNFLTWYSSFIDTELNRFKKEVPNGTVKTIIDANHYIFISNPAETEKMIRDFI